ncbi:MAG: DUF4386 family protein [Xanthomonadaceae bacterium]|nr:DUF4386 family protein [Xanthomonadaceae bacterium]MDE1963185.1 DUF4386 family protein [Xanthomonadaceae bacterium]
MPLVVLAFFAGTLSILLLLASLQPPPATPAEELLFAASHRGGYALFASIVVVWSVFSVPLSAILARLLRAKGDTLASAAQLLVAVGVLLLGFGIFMHVGALLSIEAAGAPPSAADATYQAAIWHGLSFYLTDPGLMAFGLGQFLFGWLAWRSGVLPNWVALVGMVGGVAGLLTLAVYQTGVLALAQLICFGIWGFATGISLLRGRQAASLDSSPMPSAGE